MYDTLNIWFPYEESGYQKVLSELPRHLNKIKKISMTESGYTTLSGTYRELWFNIKPMGLQINGSLCKFYHGNNQKTLTIQEVETAVEWLTDLTGLPLGDAKVHRIDFSDNYIMSQPVNRYYDFLGAATYYHRSEKNNGLYYEIRKRTLLFYGKVYEQKTVRRVPIIPEFEGKHVLRYEMRLKNKVASQLGVPEVKLSMLYEPEFYCKLLMRYREEYRSIMKKNRIVVPDEVVAGKDELFNQLMLLGGIQMGGEDVLLRTVDDVKKQKKFKNPMQALRLKKKIKKVFRSPDLTRPSELIEELNEKIERLVEAELGLFS